MILGSVNFTTVERKEGKRGRIAFQIQLMYVLISEIILFMLV